MTRNHFSTSYSNSCLKVPVNPFNQMPSPSYERRRTITPHAEDEGHDGIKTRSTSAASHPQHKSPTDERAAMKSSNTSSCTDVKQDSGPKSPLESFLDFYDSIPDYQEVTHLSDREFTNKLKILREKQRQYLDSLSGRKHERNSPAKGEYETDYKRKGDKEIYKLELAEEWVNKSCDSLDSLSKKCEAECRISNPGETQSDSKTSSTIHGPLKYTQYGKKLDSEPILAETGSSSSVDSAVPKVMRSRSSCGNETKHNKRSSPTRQSDYISSHVSREGRGNLKGPLNFYNSKDEYHWQSTPTSPTRRSNPLSCGRRSIETSELNIPECSSSLAEGHHDGSSFEDFYFPAPTWMQSDSESALGTSQQTTRVGSSRNPTSRSIPGSPTMKHDGRGPNTSEREKIGKEKGKRRKRKSNRRPLTKPIPFSFMRNDGQSLSRLSRSTPELHSLGLCRPPSPKLFRARPIPRNLFSNYVYQKQQEDEFCRALKRKIRAEDMLRGASLPPSMEFRERVSRIQAASTSSENSSQRHKHQRRQRTQRTNITTSTSPYSLRISSLSPRRKASPGTAGSSLYSEPRRCRPTSSRSNLAAVLRMQSARQRLEEEHHRLRQEQRRRAETRLKARVTRLTPAWRSIQYSTEEDLALRAAARREEERMRRAEYGQLMRHMLDRVYTIPTLFERQSTSASRYASERTSPCRMSPVRTSPSRSSSARHLERIQSHLDEDEDAADVHVYMRRRQSRSETRGVRRKGRRSPAGPLPLSRSPTPSPSRRLQSPDRLDSVLRYYHRQLPHSQSGAGNHSMHRVEFQDRTMVTTDRTKDVGRNNDTGEEEGEEVEEEEEDIGDDDEDDAEDVAAADNAKCRKG